jgi:hypothetical protein
MAVLVCALHLVACGDDSGGGVSSGLPPTEKLSSLDTADAQQLCTTVAKSFNNLLSTSDKKRITCTALAAPLSVTESSSGQIQGDIAKCKDLVTRCLNGEDLGTGGSTTSFLPDQFIDESSCTDASSGEQFNGCDASVSEFESCANALRDTLSGQLAIISCDSLSDPEKLMNMNSNDVSAESQPECKTLTSKCPDLSFGDSSGDMSSTDGSSSDGSSSGSGT